MQEGLASRERHAVCFYADDPELAAAVAPSLADALRAGGSAVIVATEAHRRLFEDSVHELGLTDDQLNESLVMLDARTALDGFMLDGRPDPDTFDATIGSLIRRQAAAAGPVFAYGEMVGLLWNEGRVAAVMELEELWNELAEQAPFSLLCGYQRATVAADHDADALDRICELHRGGVQGRPATAHESERGVAVRSFACDVDEPRAARRFTRETLLGWDRSSRLDEVVLVVSELTSNAVRHAASAFTVTIADLQDVVRIEVEDTGVSTVQKREPDHSGGRGLPLVEWAAASWGSYETDGGKVVWAEVAD